MAEPAPYRTPRWVKIFGIVVIGLILLLVVGKLTGLGGSHGPGRHMPPSSSVDSSR